MHKRYSWLALLTAALWVGFLAVVVAFARADAASPGGRAVSQGAALATPAPDGAQIYIVRRGDTLAKIAGRFGVNVRELAAYNGIRNPDLIYVGQRLRIPPSFRPTVPPPQVTPTPSPVPCPCEEIVILSPSRFVTITSPVTVRGIASSPFEQTVVVAVLDGSGQQIGLAPATIVGELGGRGPFTATVTFVLPTNSQPGRIQVFTQSPRDGATEHLSSIPVNVRGQDLDALLDKLEAALNARDYAVLPSLMGPTFKVGLLQSEWIQLTPDQAVLFLLQAGMGAGAPRLDFSVDARKLLGDRASFGPEVTHVVYSPGWGSGRNDDAFLMLGNVDGQARWIGLLYVRHDLIDYR